MIQLMNNEVHILKQLTQEDKDVCLFSALEGHMGQAWCDCNKTPELGFIVVADFCYILGKCKGQEDEKRISNLMNHAKGKIIKTEDPEWVRVIEAFSPERFKRFNRYSTKREATRFDIDLLGVYIQSVEEDFEIKRIDEQLFEKILANPFMADLCCFFSSIENYMTNGFGYIIEHENEIVAGASSYSFCEGMIDITIGCIDEYRGKGLAKAVASKVILECLEKKIYPVWDAVDQRSIALASRLGYEYEQEYEVYMI